MKNLTKALAVLFIIAITGSCKDMAKDFQMMTKLQDTLSKQYNTKEIHIEIKNGKTILVSFTNTKFNETQPEEKQRIACEIGRILKKIDTENKIQHGSVSFVESSKRAIVTTSTSVSYDMQLDSLFNEPVKDSVQKPTSYDL